MVSVKNFAVNCSASDCIRRSTGWQLTENILQNNENWSLGLVLSSQSAFELKQYALDPFLHRDIGLVWKISRSSVQLCCCTDVYLTVEGLFFFSFQEAICGYLLILMAVYWCSACVPLHVTSMLPVFLFPLLYLLTPAEVASNYLKVSRAHPYFHLRKSKFKTTDP